MRGVYIFDEQKIKVYNPDGTARAIMGGPGQGPGEFDSMFMGIGVPVNVSPAGYTAAQRSLSSKATFNVYKPDHKFLETFPNKYETLGMFKGSNLKIAVLSDTSYVGIEAEGRDDGEYIHTVETLAYYRGEEKTTIATYDKIIGLSPEIYRTSVNHVGDLTWDMASPEVVVYSHSRNDVIQNENGFFYTIHTFNLSTGERAEIQHPVLIEPIPVVTPDPVMSRIPRHAINKMNELYQEQFEFSEPFGKIRSDGAILYVHLKYSADENYTRFDVFDIEKRCYLRTVDILIQETGYIESIKKGNIYTIGSNTEGFRVVKVYSLPPEVYAR